MGRAKRKKKPECKCKPAVNGRLEHVENCPRRKKNEIGSNHFVRWQRRRDGYES